MPNSPGIDVLSDVLDQVDVRGMVTGGFAVRGPWRARTAVSKPLKFVALVAGSARLSTDGPGGPRGPVDLSPGDVVLLNHRTSLDVRGGTGDGPVAELTPAATFDAVALGAADPTTDDVLIGGWIQVDRTGQDLFRTAFPGLVHVHGDTAPASRLAALVAQVFREATSGAPGSAFAIRQYAQLMLVELVRASLDQDTPPAGWLRLLADDVLAPALRAVHDQPGHPWGLAELARTAGMSRTGFAERFRRVSGTTPLAYLTAWRMVVAQRALHDPDVRVKTLAAELGYGSESAFSNAFKREVGRSPLHHRRLVAAG